MKSNASHRRCVSTPKAYHPDAVETTNRTEKKGFYASGWFRFSTKCAFRGNRGGRGHNPGVAGEAAGLFMALKTPLWGIAGHRLRRKRRYGRIWGQIDDV